MNLQARIEELARRIEEKHGPGKLFFVSVLCNGCGRSVIAPTPEVLADLTEDWSLSSGYGGDDLCPRCR